MEDQHFTKTFIFIVGLTSVVFLFDLLVVFFPIPTSGIKYADILVGSLNTGWAINGIQYLLGGTPQSKKPDSIIQQTGDNPQATANPQPDEPKNP